MDQESVRIKGTSPRWSGLIEYDNEWILYLTLSTMLICVQRMDQPDLGMNAMVGRSRWFCPPTRNVVWNVEVSLQVDHK